MSIQSALLFMMLLAFLLSTGCGRGRLDRAKAEELIVSRLKASRVITNEFQIGQHTEQEFAGGTVNANELLNALASNGMITDTDVGKTQIGFV